MLWVRIRSRGAKELAESSCGDCELFGEVASFIVSSAIPQTFLESERFLDASKSTRSATSNISNRPRHLPSWSLLNVASHRETVCPSLESRADVILSEGLVLTPNRVGRTHTHTTIPNVASWLHKGRLFVSVCSFFWWLITGRACRSFNWLQILGMLVLILPMVEVNRGCQECLLSQLAFSIIVEKLIASSDITQFHQDLRHSMLTHVHESHINTRT